jgi:hypothetical protein
MSKPGPVAPRELSVCIHQVPKRSSGESTMSLILRLRPAILATLVLIQGLSVGVDQPARVTAQESVGIASTVPDRYIVRLKSGTGISASSVASIYDAQPGVIIDQVYNHVFDGFAGEFTSQAAERLWAVTSTSR